MFYVNAYGLTNLWSLINNNLSNKSWLKVNIKFKSLTKKKDKNILRNLYESVNKQNILKVQSLSNKKYWISTELDLTYN